MAGHHYSPIRRKKSGETKKKFTSPRVVPLIWRGANGLRVDGLKKGVKEE